MSNGSPFPGIRPFEEHESHIFFGRQRQISYLNRSLSKKFVAVIGSSGSGKSSLVKAGLIPMLRKGNWAIATMKPQRSPIRNLVKTLTDVNWKEPTRSSDSPGISFSKIVEFNVSLSSNGIVESYVQSGTTKRLLLIVDQFEELFNFKDEKIDNKSNPANVEEALKFVNLLIQAANSSHSVYILITMRSEFLGNCSDFKGLPELINEGQFLIPRLTRTQFKEVIVKPVELFNATISASLVSQMLNDIEFDPDQLPVLQHSLMRIWNEFIMKNTVSDRVITLDAYNKVGGMSNAINEHATEILKELEKEGTKDETRIILQRITKRSPTGIGIRSPRTLKELVEVSGGEHDKVITVIESFRKEGVNFLTPPFPEPLEDHTDIDISHETLIRKWKHLKDWIQEEDEDKRKLNKLIEREEEYKSDPSNFLRGSLLVNYLNWQKYKEAKKPATISWSSIYTSRFSELIDFIDTCVKEKENLELQEQKRKKRFRNVMIAAITFAATSVIGLSSAALYQAYERNKQAAKNEVLELKSALSQDSIAEKVYNLHRQIDTLQGHLRDRDLILLKSENQKEAEIGRLRIEATNFRTRVRLVESKVEQQERIAQENEQQAIRNSENLNSKILGLNSKIIEDSTRYATENQALRTRRDQLQREKETLSRDVNSLKSTTALAVNTSQLMQLYYVSSNSPGDTTITADERHLIKSNLDLFAKGGSITGKFKLSTFSYSGEKSELLRTVLNILKKENFSTEIIPSFQKTSPMTILYFKDEHISFAYQLRKVLQRAGLNSFRFQKGSVSKGDPTADVVVATD
jgi:hypothetical protein